MLLKVLVPATAVQVPQELMRNHQLLLLGPLVRVRLAAGPAVTVVARVAFDGGGSGMTK